MIGYNIKSMYTFVKALPDDAQGAAVQLSFGKHLALTVS